MLLTIVGSCYLCITIFSLTLSLVKGLQSVRNMLNILGLFTMWILLIQIGNAPDKNWERHLSSLMPRFLQNGSCFSNVTDTDILVFTT